MCGIIGYIGKKTAVPILLDGLQALEYRGYDSAGIAVISPSGVCVVKSVGYVSQLKKKIGSTSDIIGTVGIGHTRWATHGEPTEKNAHPHGNIDGTVFVVHNGIIENNTELKKYLQKRGYVFISDTDTEVIPHLIENFLKEHAGNFNSAFHDTLKMIKGAYSLVVLYTGTPNKLYATKLSSPMVIGVGRDEHYLASDPTALIGKTRNVMYLKDGEIAEITHDSVRTTDIKKHETPIEVVRLEWDLEQAQKGNYPHFMLKEIFEGPDVVVSAIRGRLIPNKKLVKLGGLEQVKEKLKKVKRVIILACGTSYYAGLVGEYLFEEIAGIPTEVHFASEFIYRDEPFELGTVAIAISQSGETADTLSALRKVKERGLLTLGVVNMVGSTIARETDAGVYNHAGPEIGVASTKAFLSQLTVLTLMAVYLSKKDSLKARSMLLTELEIIPDKMRSILSDSGEVEKFVRQYKQFANFLFLGRRYNYPVALEGALKLKELSYIHAEGCGAGEMKHGPIALISKDFPTLALIPKNGVSQKMISNLEEIRARKGPIFAIATEGDVDVKDLADNVFYLPKTIEPLEPFLTVIPLQLFAYHMGVLRGCNVDKPRNLAKSVTVE